MKPALAPLPSSSDPGLGMARSLGRLLDQARGAREVLPHLAALERGLREQGVGAVEKVPEHWLGRICSQLASLPLPADDAPLHALLSALAARQNAGIVEWEAPSMPGGFDPQRTVVIREISHSEFMAAADEQATTIRLPLREETPDQPR